MLSTDNGAICVPFSHNGLSEGGCNACVEHSDHFGVREGRGMTEIRFGACARMYVELGRVAGETIRGALGRWLFLQVNRSVSVWAPNRAVRPISRHHDALAGQAFARFFGNRSSCCRSAVAFKPSFLEPGNIDRSKYSYPPGARRTKGRLSFEEWLPILGEFAGTLSGLCGT